MHTYGGNPNSFPISLSIPDDGVDAPSFANIMTSVEGLADRTANLFYTYAPAAALGNFGPLRSSIQLNGVTVSGGVQLAALDWDASFQCWVGMFQGVTGLYGAATHSAGDQWNAVPYSAPTLIAANFAYAGASDGNGTFTALVNTGTTQVSIVQYSVGLPESVGTPTAQPFLGTIVHADMMFLAGIGWILIGNQQVSTTYTTKFADGGLGGGGVWTDISSSLPAGWGTGTSTIIGFVHAIDFSLSSSFNVVVGMCGSAPGTDISRIMGLSGSTWTDITPSFLTGKSLTGITYNAVLKLWGVFCWDSTAAYLYTSPDQVTWTLKHSFLSGVSSSGNGGLSAVGAVWAAHLERLGNINTTNNHRAMISPDGVTWTTASFDLGITIIGPTGNALGLPQMRTNGNQIAIFNNASHAFSQQVGFAVAGSNY